MRKEQKLLNKVITQIQKGSFSESSECEEDFQMIFLEEEKKLNLPRFTYDS